MKQNSQLIAQFQTPLDAIQTRNELINPNALLGVIRFLVRLAGRYSGDCQLKPPQPLRVLLLVTFDPLQGALKAFQVFQQQIFNIVSHRGLRVV
jgi:hypothetical protein